MHATAYAHADIAEACKALGDPTRIRILALLLRAGELCVCHVEEALGITQSRASRHLAALRRAGFVSLRRDGAWVHYRIAERPGPLAEAVTGVIGRTSARDPRTRADVSRARAARRASGCKEQTR